MDIEKTMNKVSRFKLDTYFKALEQKFPVDRWFIDGIYIWPYIRIKLYFSLLSENINQDKRTHTYKNQADPLNKKRHLLINNKLVKLFKATLTNRLFFSNLKNKKIVFVGSHFHRVEEQGVAFNRFFDSMVKSNHLENDIYFLEYQKIIENSFNDNAIINLENQINAYKEISKLFQFKKKPCHIELERYDSFLNEIKNDSFSIDYLNLDVNSLIKWVEKIGFISRFYKNFFQRVSPEKIIFCGYYGWDNLYAAIYCANKLNIKTIDFQHGPQINHMVFSEWNKIPKTGYNLMPKEYWVWDKESKTNLEKWTLTRDDIQVKLAGHPYLQYKISKNTKFKSNILFSMQTFQLNKMIPEEILHLIKKWNFRWVFRLHPRSSFSTTEIVAYFDNFEIDRNSYILESPYEKPLTESLLAANLHFSAFSGCTLEARSLGVKTILINSVGYDMFKDYMDLNDNLICFLNPKENNFIEKATKVLNASIPGVSDVKKTKIINPLYF